MHRSRDLPAFVTPDSGLAQYTAAALVAKNRRLASPVSVDSLPTSGMQEDYVSMGQSAAFKLRTVLDNLTTPHPGERTPLARNSKHPMSSKKIR